MNGTQSIERAIQLLHLFDDERPNWSLQGLVAETGLKKTTIFRILTALRNEGFVEQTEQGSYRLGSELIMFGGRSMRQHRLRTVATPEMQALAVATGESVTLDVLWVDENNHPKSMVIDEVLGNHLLGLTQFVGVRFPANLTSTGKVLLAFQPRSVLESLNLDQLTGMTEDSIVTKADLIAELDAVRAQGYGLTMHEIEIGLVGIAAPILNHHGHIVAAISTAGPASRITKSKLLSFYGRLKAAADNISNEIGYRSEPAKSPHIN